MRTTAAQSREDAQNALNIYTQTGSYPLTASTMQCSLTAARLRVQRAIDRGYKANTVPAPIKLKAKAAKGKDLEENAEPSELLAADRRAAATSIERDLLKRKLKQSEQDNEARQKRLDLLLALGEEKRKPYSIPSYKSKDGQGVFVGVASDWHLEEDVDPQTIAGYANEYNPTIARERATKFFQSYVFMLKAWRNVGRCDTAVLAVLGDIITGYIHDELMESNHLSPTQAIMFGHDVISAGIDYILTKTDLKQLIVPWCYGNHGRTTEKSRIQTGAANSHEWMLGQNLKREWAKESRVGFHVADGYHNVIDLFGDKYRIRFHHGDQIAYGGGVGGITIPVNKKIKAWNQGLPRPADLDVFGHFHQLIDGGNFICNGSLIGHNAYGVSIGAPYHRPAQACFWIDSEKGKTQNGELFVA